MTLKEELESASVLRLDEINGGEDKVIYLEDAVRIAEHHSKSDFEPLVIRQAADELAKVIDAGNKLAEAAHYLQKEYDGIHRLRLALSEWYKVRADEFGRDKSSLSV